MQSQNITKRFEFCAAHQLTNHDGKCARLHGHNYLVDVQIRGELVKNQNDPKQGMIVDFGDLSKVLKPYFEAYDHKTLCWGNEPFLEAMREVRDGPFLHEQGILLLGFRTTAENLARYFSRYILKKGFDLASLTVYETPESSATYIPTDEDIPTSQNYVLNPF